MYSRDYDNGGALINVLMSGLRRELKIEERVIQGWLFTRAAALQ